MNVHTNRKNDFSFKPNSIKLGMTTMTRPERNMEAFRVFLLHWKKEENVILQIRARKKSRHHSRLVCTKLLEHRILLDTFRFVVWSFNEMIRTGEHMTDPFFFKHILDYVRLYGFEILNHKVSFFGICEFCHEGLVMFTMDKEAFHFSADCKTCKKNHLTLDDSFGRLVC